jgi:hypothetical protein
MGSRVVGLRRAGGITASLVLFVLVALMVAVVPAMAASQKVKTGDTQLTIPKAQVTALTAKSVAIMPLSPVTFSFQWNSGVSWWFDAPMASGGTFDWNAKKGTFYHDGGLRFANVSNNKTLRMGGLRVIVNGSKSFSFSAAVGDAPAVRAIVMTATNAAKFTKSGKSVKIEGIQFKLTAAGAQAIKNALGVELSTSTLFADTDVLFKLK